MTWIGLLPPILILGFINLQNSIVSFQMKTNDILRKLRAKRLSFIEETFNGVKIVKFNALEKDRMSKLTQIRDSEDSNLYTYFLYTGATDLIGTAAIPLISLACFLIYWLFYGGLDSSEIYSILALVGGLEMPFKFFMYGKRSKGICKQISGRLVKLIRLLSPGLQKDDLELMKGEMVIERGYFTWENLEVKRILEGTKSTPEGSNTKKGVKSDHNEQKIDENDAILKNISLKINAGEFVGIIGKVGSGKSSLLKALANEIPELRKQRHVSSVKKRGKMSITPQESFLINASVKENITFGSEIDEEKYTKVIKLCQLEPDFKQLIDGDKTVVGERGVNLSGGQKQRISIARALYSGTDIYLIDDALSALDSHVASKIMEGVFEGELKERTRVMVTHRVGLLGRFDRLVLMSGGKIVCQGSLKEIQGLKHFQDFVGDLKDESGHHNHQQEARKDDSQKNDNSEVEKKDDKNEGKELNRGKNKSKEGEKVDEKRQKKSKKASGIVGLDTYLYFARIVGFNQLALLTLLLTLFIASNYSLDYFLSAWMNNTLGLTTKLFYPLLYTLLLLVMLGVSCLRTYIFAKAFTKSGSRLLLDLFSNLLKRKLQFFDTTPIGEIMTRCGSDINSVDIQLPYELIHLLNPLFMIFGVSALASIVSPLQFGIIVIVLWGIRDALGRFMVVSVELRRMIKAAWSPIISSVSELTKGVETLRVYGKTEYLVGVAKKRCDARTASLLHEMMFFHWIVVRSNP